MKISIGSLLDREPALVSSNRRNLQSPSGNELP